MSLRSILGKFILSLQILFFLCMIAIIILDRFSGLVVLKTSGNSMLPLINQNYALERPANPADLSVGDIVTFASYPEGRQIKIIHRLISISTDRQYVVTKGDNNQDSDVYYTADGTELNQLPINEVENKVITIIPHPLGHLFADLSLTFWLLFIANSILQMLSSLICPRPKDSPV